YLHWDGDVEGDKESDNSFTLDQAEIDFLFDFSPVTAQVDIQYIGNDDDIELEQAFATYAMENGGAVTAGRYASMLGFEAFEPTGLYQYSYAYSLASADSIIDAALSELGEMDLGIIGELGAADVLGIAIGSWLPGYNDGVKYTAETDTGFFGISLQDGAVIGSDDRLGGDDFSSWAAEIAAAWTGEEGLTLFIGGAYEEVDVYGDSADFWVINSYISYETGDVTYGVELNYGEFEDVDHLSALAMANFAYSEQASVTGRISYWELGLGDLADADFLKFTAAHSYAFTDNLALIAEISYVDGDLEGASYDELSGALELLFSF
ncbi:MAG: hypothetical protein ACP5I4_08640, partial [Oceanipulchritudo sp.]